MKSDIQIQKDVIEELRWEPFLSSFRNRGVREKWYRDTLRRSRFLFQKNNG